MMVHTDAAVAANTSDLFAVVKSPTLMANRSMNTPIMTSFVVGLEILYRVRIATNSRMTVIRILTMVTKRATLFSGMYAMLSSRLSALNDSALSTEWKWRNMAYQEENRHVSLNKGRQPILELRLFESYEIRVLSIQFRAVSGKERFALARDLIEPSRSMMNGVKGTRWWWTQMCKCAFVK
jgi:hypothetical protein